LVLLQTLEGSLACFLGSYAAGITLSSWYQHLGFFRVNSPGLAWGCAVTSLVGTAVESLPVSDIDNLLIAAAVSATAYALW
jgi:dolichol kinase